MLHFTHARGSSFSTLSAYADISFHMQGIKKNRMGGKNNCPEAKANKGSSSCSPAIVPQQLFYSQGLNCHIKAWEFRNSQVPKAQILRPAGVQ